MENVYLESSNRKNNGGRIIRGVKQFSLDGKLIASFDKMVDAAKSTGVSNGDIASCCRGNKKKAGGFIWKYDNSKLKLKIDPLDKLLDFLH